MKEIATVLHINNDIITVQCGEQENCKSCSSMFCKASKGRVFEALNIKEIPLHENDNVEVYMDPGKTVKAGFVILILPLLLFFLLYLIGGLLFSTEGIKILFGTAGLLLGFGAAYLWGKRVRNKEMPIIYSRSE
jgi:positive regulator of sigma E activity